MANTIALAKNFVPVIDEIYKRESLTSALDVGGDRVNFVGSNKCNIYKYSVDGLGTYGSGRNNTSATGFPVGSVTGTWEEFTLLYDRGASFSVDAMDNEESLGLGFGALLGEFMRTQAVPESDAYTFAKICSGVVIDESHDGLHKEDIAVGTTNCMALIDAAQQQMQEDEVPEEGRILYVSPTMYAGIKKDVTRYLANENTVSRSVGTIDGMPVIVVPQSRFNTAITLNSGASDSFGFDPTAGGYKINFMIVHPSAVLKVNKHTVPRIFSPEVNQAADSWLMQYRTYGDVFVEDNKKSGIYVHCKNTANS